MKRVACLIVLSVCVGALGCGKDDPNKNLKPVDPNAAKPQPASDAPGGGGEKKNLDAPSPVVK